MNKVIITGAGGFVGSALTQKFIENGFEVIAISQAFNPMFPNHSSIKRIESEIIDKDNLIKVIPEDEYIAFYNLAWRGVNGPEKTNPYIQIANVKMALICADVALALHCPKYLCSGTIAERSVDCLEALDKTSGGMMYGTAKHCTHLILETYCKNMSLPFVWMQFSNIYGPQNKTGNLVSYTLEQLIKGREATFGPAKQPYDLIFIDDIIEAIYRLGIKDTKRNFYFIGSGKPRMLKDYLLTIGELFERKELVKIGVRPDDGIKYDVSMFDTKELIEDIGEYVSGSFEEHIKYTIANY